MAAPEKSDYFDLHDEGDVLLFTVLGHELRHPEPAQEFGTDVLKVIQQSEVKNAVIDLHKIRYMSSTGFAVLVNLGRKILEAGGKVRLCGLTPDVRIGANIIGLARAVPVDDTRHEALDAIRG